MTLSPPNYFYSQLITFQKPLLHNKRADEISEYLIKNTTPEDEVQSLDWTGGSTKAMLDANIRLATPFIYDFHFYHHISNPYIQNLRERFISELQSSKPDFIIKINSHRGFVRGPDTTTEFTELENFINQNYKQSIHKNGYSIYKKSPE